MHRVAARLDTHVDHGTRFPTVFTAGILLCFEFINGIDGQHRTRVTCGHHCVHHALRHPGIVAVDAVDHEVVVVRTAAVRAVRPTRVARIFRYARAQVQQVFEVSSVQGQVIDHLVGDRSAQLGVIGFDQRTLGLDCDQFSLPTRLE